MNVSIAHPKHFARAPRLFSRPRRRFRLSTDVDNQFPTFCIPAADDGDSKSSRPVRFTRRQTAPKPGLLISDSKDRAHSATLAPTAIDGPGVHKFVAPSCCGDYTHLQYVRSLSYCQTDFKFANIFKENAKSASTLTLT